MQWRCQGVPVYRVSTHLSLSLCASLYIHIYIYIYLYSVSLSGLASCVPPPSAVHLQRARHDDTTHTRACAQHNPARTTQRSGASGTRRVSCGVELAVGSTCTWRTRPTRQQPCAFWGCSAAPPVHRHGKHAEPEIHSIPCVKEVWLQRSLTSYSVARAPAKFFPTGRLHNWAPAQVLGALRRQSTLLFYHSCCSPARHLSSPAAGFCARG